LVLVVLAVRNSCNFSLHWSITSSEAWTMSKIIGKWYPKNVPNNCKMISKKEKKKKNKGLVHYIRGWTAKQFSYNPRKVVENKHGTSRCLILKKGQSYFSIRKAKLRD